MYRGGKNSLSRIGLGLSSYTGTYLPVCGQGNLPDLPGLASSFQKLAPSEFIEHLLRSSRVLAKLRGSRKIAFTERNKTHHSAFLDVHTKGAEQRT